MYHYNFFFFFASSCNETNLSLKTHFYCVVKYLLEGIIEETRYDFVHYSSMKFEQA